jgi:very-short-patch-repair endonuclease
MVGEDQALLVERLVLEHLEPGEVERRRIISGNPAQFQGDERDVMFISMVDSPGVDGAALPRRAEDMYRQRFNVAASRAKDQMWVVHSLESARDLKDGDLRRMLIEYADDPASFRTADEPNEGTRRSKPAEIVKTRLTDVGYRVVERFRVGYFCIDLVVHDLRGRRLAVVCDGAGDRTPEEIAEDLARQATLERLGWQFSRVRASLLYSDPEEALRGVREKIERLGIEARTTAADEAGSDDGSAAVDRVVKRSRELVKRWKRRAGARRK